MKSKISKAEAEYVAHASVRPCHECSMFQRPSYCTLVAGVINANGHCKYWESKIKNWVDKDK